MAIVLIVDDEAALRDSLAETVLVSASAASGFEVAPSEPDVGR